MSERRLLIVGNNNYEDSRLHPLVTPSTDAEALATVLLDETLGSFKKEPNKSKQILVNQTADTIRRQIARFLNDSSLDDLVVLYFSGHGVLDSRGNLYLAATDTEQDLLEATAISASFISDLLNRCRSKRQVLILDCCFSGAFAKGAKSAEPKVGESVGLEEAFKGTGYGRVILTASNSTQYAWQGTNLIGNATSSVFTYHLINGIKTGEADVDGDGSVSVDELYDYIYEKIISNSNENLQTPQKWSFGQEGKLFLARNPYSKVEQIEVQTESAKQAFIYTASRYGIGYESLSVTCIICNDGSAKVLRRIKVNAHAEIAHLDTYLLIDGNVNNENRSKVRSINDEREIMLVNTKKEAGQLSGELLINPALQKGDSLIFAMEENLSSRLFAIGMTEDELSTRNSPYDYFNWNINRPTKQLILEVHFPNFAKPYVFGGEVRYASASGFPSVRLHDIELKHLSPPKWVEPHNKKEVLKLEVNYPMVGLIYGIRWQPLVSGERSDIK